MSPKYPDQNGDLETRLRGRVSSLSSASGLSGVELRKLCFGHGAQAAPRNQSSGPPHGAALGPG